MVVKIAMIKLSKYGTVGSTGTGSTVPGTGPVSLTSSHEVVGDHDLLPPLHVSLLRQLACLSHAHMPAITTGFRVHSNTDLSPINTSSIS